MNSKGQRKTKARREMGNFTTTLMHYVHGIKVAVKLGFSIIAYALKFYVKI